MKKLMKNLLIFVIVLTMIAGCSFEQRTSTHKLKEITVIELSKSDSAKMFVIAISLASGIILVSWVINYRKKK